MIFPFTILWQNLYIKIGIFFYEFQDICWEYSCLSKCQLKANSTAESSLGSVVAVKIFNSANYI